MAGSFQDIANNRMAGRQGAPAAAEPAPEEGFDQMPEEGAPTGCEVSIDAAAFPELADAQPGEELPVTARVVSSENGQITLSLESAAGLDEPPLEDTGGEDAFQKAAGGL